MKSVFKMSLLALVAFTVTACEQPERREIKKETTKETVIEKNEKKPTSTTTTETEIEETE